MKINPSVISQLALMICGDEQYTDIFPYRSSSYLTEFFRSVDLNYIHDGSTRKWWVQGILDKLNTTSTGSDERFPSPELKKIIEQLLHQAEYISKSSNRDKAIGMMNDLLKSEGFFIYIDPRSKNAQLRKHLGEFVSTSVDEKKVDRVITFSPTVFKIPEESVNSNLVVVIMPFLNEFDPVYTTIHEACRENGLECQRADKVWENSEIIQDIFQLIYTSSIVVADLSGEKPNVFYELGIAHTLGKHVIPIVQNTGDLAFDVKHHRAQVYSNTPEGRAVLNKALQSRLKTVAETLKK
jgi:predicted transcriptional regulator